MRSIPVFIRYLSMVLAGFTLFLILPTGCLTSSDSPTGLQLSRDTGIIDTSGFLRDAGYNYEIKPSLAVKCWEERILFDSGRLYVTNASIDSCANREVPCPGPLSAYRTDKGEIRQAMPVSPYIRYFVGWTGEKIVVWNDEKATRSFLLPIDSEGDAVYWAAELGYSTDETDGRYWIRSKQDGYEMIGERMDSMCHPYRKIKVLLHIDADGGYRELARKTLEEDYDICMMI